MIFQPNLNAQQIRNVLIILHVLRRNAKILASQARVEWMLNAELPSIELYAFATQALLVILTGFAKNVRFHLLYVPHRVILIKSIFFIGLTLTTLHYVEIKIECYSRFTFRFSFIIWRTRFLDKRFRAIKTCNLFPFKMSPMSLGFFV